MVERFNGINFKTMSSDELRDHLNHMGMSRDAFPTPEHEAHYTKNPTPFAKVLESINLHGLDVVDIGLGGGAIAELAFRQGARKVIAYEINPERKETQEFVEKCRREGWNLELRTGDFRKEDLSYWNNGHTAVVSNPPYALLPDIAAQMEKNKPVGSLLLMSAWRYGQDYKPRQHEVKARQWGQDFSPPAHGDHYIVMSGFEGRVTKEAELPPANIFVDFCRLAAQPDKSCAKTTSTQVS
ncbi:MAG: hypothetical protein EBV03_07670 [Proteobacteria bacterium]|nr:hypothetical protein [Pseudomonadota bacterium]